MSDERHNAPSASAIGRIANCPPSHALGRQYPNPSTAESTHGDRVHLALELNDSTGLDADELETFEMCRDQRHSLVEEWIGEDEYAIYKEQRLGLTKIGLVRDLVPDSKLLIRFSGKADWVGVAGKRALIADYKTLHGEHAHAAENDQLRALAVLVWLRHNVDEVRVAIIQPWKGKPTVADYGTEQLRAAHEWLLRVLNKEELSQPKDAVAGDWCKFCAARVNCDAFTGQALAVVETTSINLPNDDKTARKAMFARAAELSNADLAARHRGLKWISWYVSAVEGNVRMRAAEGGEFAERYFHLVEGKPRATISDVSAVWSSLAAMGVTPEDFTKGCKTTKKAITGMVKAVTGFKGRELGAAVDAAIKEGVTLSKPPLKLVEVGAAIEDEEDEE